MLEFNNPKYTKAIIVQTLEFSKSIFYKMNLTNRKDLKINKQIMKIYEDYDDTLGHKKLAFMLKIEKNRVRRIIKKIGVSP